MHNFNRSVFFLAILGASVMANAQKWCFIVAGDGRADSKTKRPEDQNGINVLITKEIADAVLAEKAKFLAWTGDLAYGYCKTRSEGESQLRAWIDIMKPVYDAHIPILPCRGNHDAGNVDSKMVWNRVFSGPYALPMNGPRNEKGLTYFYGKGDVLLLALDQYGEKKEVVNQAWLDSVLGKYRKPFVFAFAHEPAFMDGAHKDNMDASPTDRDRFWESMIGAGSRVYFGGHDHLYDHMTVVRAGGKPGPVMHQVTAGTAGAPFYPQGEYTGNNTGWKPSRVKNIVNTYGYVLVTIDGRKATIEFKGRIGPGKYQTMDSFAYSTPRHRMR